MRKTGHDANSENAQLVGYARVSTSDQSVAMQLEALTKYGVPVENIWQEKKSAGRRRVKLEQCLKYLEEGDTLVVWKMDRFARSMLDLLSKLKNLDDRGVKFVSLTESIDTRTPGGRLLVHVLAALAEFERDLIAERTSAGMQRKLATGWRPGPKPKFTAEIIKEAQRLRDKGHSAPEIIEALKAKYKIKLSPRSIYLRTERPKT